MKALGYLFAIAVMCAALYGWWWLLKNGSYWLWYEDLVKETIREVVRQEALK